MVETSGRGSVPAIANKFCRLLASAEEALAEGDAASGERIAKAVSALVRAERDVAEFLAAQDAQTEEDDEAIRAELLSRIRQLVDAETSGAPDDVVERLLDEVAAL
jgi:alkanesulfonate monooxygenase SsuD/methylene tetrahydromethanopterin reductase-like flavin-dependent oxidoreductase (luciferase family)